MSQPLDQHFVPKFYFRMFTGGERSINAFRKAKEQVVLRSPIKMECARPDFYGRPEIEALFSVAEGQQSETLKHLRILAWSSEALSLEPSHIARMCEAILFQRARTELVIEKVTPATDAFMLEVFKEFVRQSPDIDRDAVLDQVERGNVRFTEEPHSVVLRSIVQAFEDVPLITDLDFHLVRNRTDYPFVFGDSPVVFCNTYYRNVTHRGVLGLTTPGLQIFYPLDSKTLLMLLDEKVYLGRSREPLLVDVDERCDVSQLNALQLHHSHNSFYFADPKDADYVTDLWEMHKSTIMPPRDRLENRKGWLVEGIPVDGPLYQRFEPHLNFRLSLSFIECTPIPASQHAFRLRDPKLYADHLRGEFWNRGA